MKSLAQRGGQSLLATPSSVNVSNDRANVELLDLGDFLDGKVAFVGGQRTHHTILLVGHNAVDHPLPPRRRPARSSLRVRVITLQNFRLDNGSAFQIGDMLGLVNHIASSILGAPHLGLRIMRVFPFLIARPASRPLLIEAAHCPLIPRVNTLLPRQLPHILPIGLLRIAMHQSTQTRIGFDHTGIDPQVSTPKKSVGFERTEHDLENPW
jgi:hypothetical protein